VANVSDLIEQGILPIGTILVWKRRGGKNFTAEVLENGLIRTSDGRVHKSPSGAARSLVGRPVDGWAVWRTINNETLSELRSKLIRA
jgi:hypothetical protein